MTLLAGRYALQEVLGSGGMSRVHVATDQLLHRRVAVKLIREDLAADPVVRQRLLREARAAASFTHPNAVAVYDTGEQDGVPFIVMELVEGQTLADRLQVTGPMEVDEARRITGDVLLALEAAHERDLVHRDVKPANVLLPADGSGAKLADFGIAKEMRQAAEALTMTGQVLGTPRYLAPEQTAGHQATPQSDLYAVGVLCFEMLDGQAPFSGTNPIAVAMAHQTDDPPSLAERRPDVPAELAAAVHRALAKQPSERFASAAQMRAAILGGGQAMAGAATTQIVGAGAAPTEVIPAGTAAAAPRSSAPAILAIVVALILLAVAGFALSRMVDDGDTPVAEPEPEAQEEAVPDDPPPAEPAPTTEPPQAEPEAAPPEEEPAPQDSIQALIADLSENPDAAGKKGEDLLDKLEGIGEKEPKDQSKEARDLIREIGKWVEKDELDAATGERAVALLEPIAQQDPGGGRGRNDDDDDDDDD